MNTETSLVPAETGLHTATPTRCYRAMRPQGLDAGTPAQVLGTLATALLALPRALVLAPALIRRRV